MIVKIKWPKKVEGNYVAQVIPPFYGEIIERGEGTLEKPALLGLDIVELYRYKQHVDKMYNLLEEALFGKEEEPCEPSSTEK